MSHLLFILDGVRKIAIEATRSGGEVNRLIGEVAAFSQTSC
jgi:hypothetical protein